PRQGCCADDNRTLSLRINRSRPAMGLRRTSSIHPSSCCHSGCLAWILLPVVVDKGSRSRTAHRRRVGTFRGERRGLEGATSGSAGTTGRATGRGSSRRGRVVGQPRSLSFALYLAPSQPF